MKFVLHGLKCSSKFLTLERSIATSSGRTSNLANKGVPTFCCPRFPVVRRDQCFGGRVFRIASSSSRIVSFSFRELPADFAVRGADRSSSSINVGAASPNSDMDPETPPSENMRRFQIVVAATKEHGIGKQGTLPWRLPTDMKFFKTVTSSTSTSSKRNAVIMGRHTWESIPAKFRPLQGRLNVILTRSGSVTPTPPEGVHVSKSFTAALALLASSPYDKQVETVFVIGGGQIYREAMASPLCQVIHLTEVDGDVECDTFMPAVNTSIFRVWAASIPLLESNLRISFVTYVRASTTKDALPVQRLLPKSVLETHEEYQYLNLIDDIIKTGMVKGDRTGTGTFSKFGCQMRFNLRKSFPLLTTKRVFWRGVVEELLWFISGSTNAKVLHDKGVTIWDGNGSREYLDKLGLRDREEGDLGPVYGFQWRHFGAKYIDMQTDYTGHGFDQLKDVIQKIKSDPDDRRIILSAWNPDDLKLMALPPCHMFAQFYVANQELSCQMYQRSCDMGLGVPFNIASYALLTCILAHVCDLVPGDFIHVLGDAHVYKNHVEPLQEQLQNVPKPFPSLQINTSNRDIDSFVAADFELIKYDAHKQIRMKMAV